MQTVGLLIKAKAFENIDFNKVESKEKAVEKVIESIETSVENVEIPETPIEVVNKNVKGKKAAKKGFKPDEE
jgi:hypothetical protein